MLNKEKVAERCRPDWFALVNSFVNDVISPLSDGYILICINNDIFLINKKYNKINSKINKLYMIGKNVHLYNVYFGKLVEKRVEPSLHLAYVAPYVVKDKGSLYERAAMVKPRGFSLFIRGKIVGEKDFFMPKRMPRRNVLLVYTEAFLIPIGWAILRNSRLLPLKTPSLYLTA